MDLVGLTVCSQIEPEVVSTGVRIDHNVGHPAFPLVFDVEREGDRVGWQIGDPLFQIQTADAGGG